jgi:hypothetical protein
MTLNNGVFYWIDKYVFISDFKNEKKVKALVDIHSSKICLLL